MLHADPDASTLENLIAIGQRAARPFVVVGQFPMDGSSRIGLLDVSGPRPSVLADAWLREPVALANALGVALGAWDVMYATQWKYAWGEGRLWDKRGIRVETVGPAVARVSGVFDGCTEIAVRSVRASLSPNWVARSVSLVDTQHNTYVVARQREILAMLDPSYDWIDLTCDTGWCTELAKFLGVSLGVSVDIDAALR